MVSSGRIEVISGCMFSGKSEELLRRVRRQEFAGLDVVGFIPSVAGSQGVIGSREGRSFSAVEVSADSTGVNAVIDNGMGADVVVIDEFNLLTEGFVYAVEELADTGVRVIVAGVDQTFRGEPFEPMGELLAVADDVEKLTAVCEKCGGEATKTQRLINGEPAPYDSQTIKVGGEEQYEARCRNCHTIS